jgi:AraC family transcriptional regulator
MMQSMMFGTGQSDLKFRVRGHASNAVARLELNDFCFDRPQDVDFEPQNSILDLALSRRVGQARGHYPDVLGHRDRSMGDVIFLPAGRRVRSRWLGGPQSSITLQFNRGSDSQRAWTAAELDLTLDIQDGFIRDALMRLARELEAPGFESALMVEAICIQIGITLGRYFKDASGNGVRLGGKLSTAQVQRIMDLLDVAGPSPAVSALAHDCGISTRHFCRMFRATTGTSLSEFATERRVGHARSLLANKRIPIKQVSWECGFQTPAAFSAAFRRATGYQPSNYRRLMSW